MKTKLIAVLALLFGLALINEAGAFSFEKTKVVFSKGQDTWVKIKKANKKMVPFDHPHSFTAEEMDGVLASIRYMRPGMFQVGGKKGKEYDLFTDEERAMLAAPLAEAFAQAGPDQWVDFSVATFRGQILIGSTRQSDGVMFIKDGKLNVAFRNIAEKKIPDQKMNTYDPTKGYRAMTKLVASEGQEQEKGNWIAMSASELPAAAASSGTEPEQGTQAQQRTVKQRLQDLQELYDEGLITEEEYNKKREEILKDL